MALGANLPGRLGEELGIHQGILISTLAVLVLISFVNYARQNLIVRQVKSSPRGEDGARALLESVERGNMSLIRRLLNMGVEIDMRDASGRTALTIAAEQGNNEVVRTLLQHGADHRVTDSDGRTPYEVAKDSGNTDTADLLIRVPGRQATQ